MWEESTEISHSKMYWQPADAAATIAANISVTAEPSVLVTWA